MFHIISFSSSLYVLQVAKFKIPKYIKFVNEYPLTVTGKVQKYKIREMATKSLGLEHIKPGGTH